VTKADTKLSIPFILKLADVDGTPRQWVETLSGDTARRWYNIYRDSNWCALREEHAEVFRHAVSEEEADQVRRSRRCVVIKLDLAAEGLESSKKWDALRFDDGLGISTRDGVSSS
jgi:hypothetical protein